MYFFIPFVVAIAVIAILVAFLRRAFKEAHQNDEKLLLELESEPICEPVVYSGAKAVAKRSELLRRGTKTPHHELMFYATFLLPDGKRLELELPEETWRGIDKDQEGTLVVQNEIFFAFGDGEEIE